MQILTRDWGNEGSSLVRRIVLALWGRSSVVDRLVELNEWEIISIRRVTRVNLGLCVVWVVCIVGHLLVFC